jgi:hypothetical protein
LGLGSVSNGVKSVIKLLPWNGCAVGEEFTSIRDLSERIVSDYGRHFDGVDRWVFLLPSLPTKIHLQPLRNGEMYDLHGGFSDLAFSIWQFDQSEEQYYVT